jgi:hypothetical protein
MPSATYVKSSAQLLAWTDFSNGTITPGSEQPVTTKMAAKVYVQFARKANTALTAGFPNVRVEGNAYSSGNNDKWSVLGTVSMAVGSSVAATTLSAGASAGASTFTVTSATGITAGDVLFLGDSSTGNYEIVRVKSMSGTTVTPEEALIYAHASGSTVTDQAEKQPLDVDLRGVQRIRLVPDNSSGAAVAIEASVAYMDSVLIA